ncbi:hypothetical protein GBF38_022188, partial [Nibea albiflora]
MPHSTTNRDSKTPSRYRDTRQTEDVVTSKGVTSWKMEFFEALDFVQSGMTTAALREATLLSATNGMVGTEEDLVSLKLPGNIDVPGLH